MKDRQGDFQVVDYSRGFPILISLFDEAMTGSLPQYLEIGLAAKVFIHFLRRIWVGKGDSPLIAASSLGFAHSLSTQRRGSLAAEAVMAGNEVGQILLSISKKNTLLCRHPSSFLSSSSSRGPPPI